MMEDNNFHIAIVVALVAWLAYTVMLHRRRTKNGYPYPPGPTRLPIIGNALDIPSSEEWIKAAEWRKEFGDLVYVELFARPILFINSYEAALDLLGKRAAVHSSRPFFTMANELLRWDWMLALMPYGDHWRKHRTAINSFLNPPAITRFVDVEQKIALKTLGNILLSPEKFERHLRTAVGATTLMLAYGHEVKDEKDDLLSLVEHAGRFFSEATLPASFAVNALPFLKYVPEWIPGAGFQKFANKGRTYSSDMLRKPFEAAKNKVVAGISVRSMTSDLIIQNMDENGDIEDEDYIARCAGTVYAGGGDTTVSVLMMFVMAMAMNPDVQRRGQEELDIVIGHDRLPTYEDMSKLPYVEAMGLEVLRYANVAPLGGPRASLADDVYKGYFIPRGTMLLPNSWLMANDPAVYHDPEKFLPERHITAKGKTAEMSPLRYAFGFGRRYCPGRYLVMQELFINAANILFMFDISKAKNPDGSVIEPVFRLNRGTVRVLQPFRCSILPRSEGKVEVLRRALDRSDECECG